MDSTERTAIVATFLLAEAGIRIITIKFADYNNIYYLCALYGYEESDIRGDDGWCGADVGLQQG
jgi:hypothetical protein